MNNAEYFLRTGRALCDECGAAVEQYRIDQADGLGPFLCQECANALLNYVDKEIKSGRYS